MLNSYCCWPWGVAVGVACIPREILLGKTKVSFIGSYEFDIVSASGVRTFVHFFSYHWDLIRHRYVHTLCMLP